MALAILIWLACGIGAAIVARTRGASSGLWFVLGVLFGPFGLLFSFLSGPSGECAYCRKRIHPEAVKCPYCQSEFRHREDPAVNAAPQQGSNLFVLLILLGIVVIITLSLYINPLTPK